MAFKIDPLLLFTLVKGLVRTAEKLFPEPKTGETKRDWVVRTANEKIDIPFINEKGEAKLIGFVVDTVVALFNSDDPLHLWDG